ncbi:MAG TPA: hypothetical protein PLZ52_12295 [Bacteroidales bacterium]|nr:hypothetical protein [Bacteroidales bacterium]HOE05989.1 hypothetical protein [Bacteroidales bacterium]HQL70732.1 hypothetical protein [Bacteroidales bacterium]
MKRLILLFVLTVIFGVALKAQWGYRTEYKTLDGVIILYKYAHEKMFDKTSPINLRIKIKNTNDYPVEVSFRIMMESGFTDIKQSEMVDICIPKKLARSGKLHGLNFETGVNDVSLFEKNEIEWYMEPLSIEKSDKCIQLQSDDE